MPREAFLSGTRQGAEAVTDRSRNAGQLPLQVSETLDFFHADVFLPSAAAWIRLQDEWAKVRRLEQVLEGSIAVLLRSRVSEDSMLVLQNQYDK